VARLTEGGLCFRSFLPGSLVQESGAWRWYRQEQGVSQGLHRLQLRSRWQLCRLLCWERSSPWVIMSCSLIPSQTQLNISAVSTLSSFSISNPTIALLNSSRGLGYMWKRAERIYLWYLHSNSSKFMLAIS
jgi:hypothetical protein